MLVDLLDQPDVPYQPVHRADAAHGQSAIPVAQFVVNVAGLEQRSGLRDPIPRLQASLDSLLALAEKLSSDLVHSKCPPSRLVMFWSTRH